MMASMRAGRSSIVSAPVGCLHCVRKPSAFARRSRSSADWNDPATPRKRSWSGSSPSSETPRRSTGLDGLFQPSWRELTASGLDPAIHAVGADARMHLGPVGAGKPLRRSRTPRRSQPRQRLDDVQAFICGQFARTPLPGPRAAMDTFQVACQRELPARRAPGRGPRCPRHYRTAPGCPLRSPATAEPGMQRSVARSVEAGRDVLTLSSCFPPGGSRFSTPRGPCECRRGRTGNAPPAWPLASFPSNHRSRSPAESQFRRVGPGRRGLSLSCS